MLLFSSLVIPRKRKILIDQFIPLFSLTFYFLMVISSLANSTAEFDQTTKPFIITNERNPIASIQEHEKVGKDVVLEDILKFFGKPSYNAPFDGCETNGYPPPKSQTQPTEFIINLDLPPEERWKELVVAKRVEMLGLLGNIQNFFQTIFHGELVKIVNEYFPYIGRSLPHPFREEIEGIAKISGIPIGQVVLYNIFYEVFTVCTSIIIQNPDGSLVHGRNLDFGLFLGWDSANETWLTTEYLRPLIVNLRFEREGKLLFRSVNFAGYVGILTGLKPNLFTLTMNERFMIRGGFMGIMEWIFGDRSPNWMSFLTRQVMENATSYTSAQKMLSKSKLLAPAYFILGGNSSNEACIITREQMKYDILPIGIPVPSMENSTWFLVQTNYDHWKSPPFFDDRLTPAVNCLTESNRSQESFKILYNVLSTRPVLNKLTTYTALMEVSGKLEVYLRDCPGDCWPW